MSAKTVPDHGHHAARVIVHDDEPAPIERAAHLRPCPLVAVCGLCGGAGTSTLAYLLARFALTAGRGHVLVADTGGTTGGLAALARTDTGRTLAEAGELLAHDLPLAPPLYPTDPDASAGDRELRVLATGPRLHITGRAEGAAALLAVARHPHTHTLVVIDCGTLQRAADRFVARNASHIAWVLPATPEAVQRTRRVLDVLPVSGARELLVARRDPTEPTAPQRALTDLAESRRAPLVLLPHLVDVERRPARAVDTAAIALQAILGVLGR